MTFDDVLKIMQILSGLASIGIFSGGIGVLKWAVSVEMRIRLLQEKK